MPQTEGRDALPKAHGQPQALLGVLTKPRCGCPRAHMSEPVTQRSGWKGLATMRVFGLNVVPEGAGRRAGEEREQAESSE